MTMHALAAPWMLPQALCCAVTHQQRTVHP